MLAQTVYEILAPPPTHLSCQIWDFYVYSLNTLKNPKMGIRYFFLWRQGKRKKREPEKAKSKSQDCCVTFNPKMKLQNFAFYAYLAHMDYGISYHCPRASTHTWSYFIVLKPGYMFSPHVWGPCSAKLHHVVMLIKICTTLLL